MKEHIHTIPVMDAIRDAQGVKCPFCLMKEKLERDAIDFITGPSYMEDDIRMETNKMGFCPSHLEKLYGEQNRLGLALMLHTFMQQMNKDAASATKKIALPLFGKNKGIKPSDKVRNHIEKVQEMCYICRMMDNTFHRYIDTFLYLWNKGGEEAKLIESVKGYCLPHFANLLAATDKLNKNKQDAFLEKAFKTQLAYMKEMEEDLEWFTLKFDYRNTNEPWKNAKDALPRAIAMLGGQYME